MRQPRLWTPELWTYERRSGKPPTMMLPRRLAVAGTLASLSTRARAQARPLRIGVLTTLSGPAADGAGSGSVLAAHMAAEAQPELAVEILRPTRATDRTSAPDWRKLGWTATA